MHMRIAIAAAIGSIVTFSLMEMGPERVGGAPAMQGRKPPSGEIATFTKLPSLGSNAEAHAVNEAGTVVVGHSFDRGGLLYAVGAAVYATERPNPNPAVFGYHEIFHLLVIAAAAAHFTAIAFFALPAA